MYIKEEDKRMYNNGYERHEDGSIEDRSYFLKRNLDKVSENLERDIYPYNALAG